MPMALEKQCAKFVQWALAEGSWQGSGLEGEDIQEKALALGLLKTVAYDPAIHGENEYDIEPGEDWYMLADPVKELLK